MKKNNYVPLKNCIYKDHLMTEENTFLASKIPQRSLAGYSPWGRKESHMTEWLSLKMVNEV